MWRWLRDRVRRGPSYEELPEPFHAQVLLDGVVVATLSDRVWTDMFWRSYRILPVGDARAIEDDALWEACRFTFRDTLTGRCCDGAFAGGRGPFVRDGRVLLRALYFARATSV